MKNDTYDNLHYLSLLVSEQCKSNHITLVHYVLSRSKGDGKKAKSYFEEFKKLSLVNEQFEQNYKSIFLKYSYQLEGRTGGVAVVSPDELLAFTKAYELQKEALKKEIEMLAFMGASKDLIDPVEKDLVKWAQFHSEFYGYIQLYQE